VWRVEPRSGAGGATANQASQASANIMDTMGFTKTAKLTFHDVPYVLKLSGDRDVLSVEVEDVDDGKRWRAKFASRFIEEITQRTGNAKKFDIFVRMLLSAVAQESDSVYIDVLTARDLEMLRRHANPQGPPTTSTAGQSDKRYLILTYRAEFDKVHYPLPLPLDERSEEEVLRALVNNLRTDLADAKQTILNLQQQQQQQLQQTQLLEQRRDEEGIEATLRQQNTDLAAALKLSRRETEQLRIELRQRGAGAGSGGDSFEAEKLKSLCSKLQSDLKAAKEEARQKETAQKQRDRELRDLRQKTERMQQQVRRLEDERRALTVRLQSAERRPSVERSRPSSRAPSADRARPSSRPASRPPSRTASRPASRPASVPPSRSASRASSVASSRDRTPPAGQGSAGRGGDRPWAFKGAASSAAADRASSGRKTTSPYTRQQPGSGAGRRTPSPGQQRQRTPSPGARVPVSRPASLRDRSSGGGGVPATSSGATAVGGTGRVASRPTSTRYGGAGAGHRAASDPRGGNIPGSSGGLRAADLYDREKGGSLRRSASRGPQDAVAASLDVSGHHQHQPGELFGLAANLGLGPGSFSAVGSSGSSVGTAAANAGATLDDNGNACDIDARLQALQAFLKQTKHVVA